KLYLPRTELITNYKPYERPPYWKQWQQKRQSNKEVLFKKDLSIRSFIYLQLLLFLAIIHLSFDRSI
ncbi:MAG: hypothetical protein ACJA0X_003256, partial [Cyclobacteriaceae bacterium]